ncbi:hypothetical protein [Pararobbsia alpina]|uniref:Uncharacterized protein n=1 Tax=Pararobbsia alpina TaxID=621374 RepID=A0A6S7BBC8_9BURK|nr:hypothetical protein [Pararobbsia alpina]CAB3784318.1 hypothetical protein LMG28138_01785 [Pararobbsia alpina]
MTEFKSFAAFAAHLERLAIAGPEVTHHIADKAAEEIQKTAKGMIGEYQGAIGPYPAWEELADRTQQERARLGFSENDPGFRTGEMQKSVERTVIDAEAAIGSNDQNLVWFDIGTSKQPPRAVLGAAALHSRERVGAIIGKTMFAWLAGMGWRKPRITSGD